MKRYSYLILMLVAVVAFSACNKWEDPEFEVPTYQGEPANMTIADIINVYTAAGHLDSICHAGETFIVRATVVSSDEGGNFYKNMVIQDETGAIQLQINQSGLCHTYPVGQTVYLNCSGHVVGNYHGVYQVGWIYNGDVGRIDGHYLDRYLSRDGLPQPVEPVNIMSAYDINEGNVCRLVRLHNVEFADDVVGKPWSEDASTTSRIIKSVNGEAVTNLVVRTSNYAKFRKALVPGGTGDLIGILSVYNSTYQLMLRTIDDVQSFGTVQDVYSVSTANGSGWDYTGWTTNQDYMLHNGVDAATDDWLVSPVLPTATVDGSTLFVEEAFFNTDATAQSKFTLYYTTNYTGDPSTTEWIPLVYSDYRDGAGFYRAQVAALNNLSGNVRIGCRYKTSSADAGQWAIKGLHFQKLVAH